MPPKKKARKSTKQQGGGSTLELSERINLENGKKALGLSKGEFQEKFYPGEAAANDFHKYRVYESAKKYIEKQLKAGDEGIPMTYGRSSNEKDCSRLCRLYALEFGLQRCSLKLRNFLCDGVYFDYDLQNCYPTLLLDLAREHDIDLSTLSEYVRDRPGCLQQMGREKAEIIAQMNRDAPMPAKSAFESRLLSDLKRAKNYFFMTCAFTHPTNNRLNPKSSVLTKVINEREFGIVSGVMQALDTKMIVYLYDGFMTDKKLPIESFPRSGSIQWVEKDIINSVAIDIVEASTEPELQRNVVASPRTPSEHDDNEIGSAAEPNVDGEINDREINDGEIGPKCKMESDIQHGLNFLGAFEGKVFRCALGVFVYDDETGLWTADANDHFRICSAHKNRLLFQAISEKGQEKTLRSKVTDAFKWLAANAPEKSGLEMTNCPEQRGKLLFRNGVLDMATFKMLQFHPKYFFMNRINRNFTPDTVDPDLIEEVLARIFDKPLTNIEKRDYFIEKLARGIAGHVEDKQFVVYLGPTNCGKGILTTFLMKAFGDCVATFDSESIIRTSETRDAKSWMWLATDNLYSRRLLVANEIRMGSDGRQLRPIDSNLVKQLVSGGKDQIKMRVNYGLPFNVVNQSTIVLFANDAPAAEPADDAYQGRANYVEGDRGASDKIQEDTATEFVKDPGVDDWVSLECVTDAFVGLLCLYYATTVQNGLTPKPDCVTKATHERATDGQETIEDSLRSKFVFYSGDKRDFLKPDGRFDWEKVKGWCMKVSDFNEEWARLRRGGGATSKTLLRQKLLTLGVVSHMRKQNGVTQRIYVGMRLSDWTDNSLPAGQEEQDEDFAAIAMGDSEDSEDEAEAAVVEAPPPAEFQEEEDEDCAIAMEDSEDEAEAAVEAPPPTEFQCTRCSAVTTKEYPILCETCYSEQYN